MRWNPYRAYIVGAVIIWAGTITGIGIVFGSDDMVSVAPILVPAAFWSVVIAPLLFRVRTTNGNGAGVSEG